MKTKTLQESVIQFCIAWNVFIEKVYEFFRIQKIVDWIAKKL